MKTNRFAALAATAVGLFSIILTSCGKSKNVEAKSSDNNYQLTITPEKKVSIADKSGKEVAKGDADVDEVFGLLTLAFDGEAAVVENKAENYGFVYEGSSFEFSK